MKVKDAKYFRSIKLESLTRDEYDLVKDSGMLYEFYPEACGIYKDDVLDKRIDIIGQNGNDGAHYVNDDKDPHINSKTQLGDFKTQLGDNPDGVDWPYRFEQGYAEKIEALYGLDHDGMFVDDYKTPHSDCEEEPVRGHDMINNPSHYHIKGVGEVINIIKGVLSSDEAKDWLTPYEGGQYTGVIERILRAPKKDQLQDLKKAHKQLGWLIQSLEH